MFYCYDLFGFHIFGYGPDSVTAQVDFISEVEVDRADAVVWSYDLFFEKIFGVDKEGFISVTLTREEIANAIGTATESTIRLLSEFKKEGYITLSGKRIKIEDKVKLQHLTEGYWAPRVKALDQSLETV